MTTAIQRTPPALRLVGPPPTGEDGPIHHFRLDPAALLLLTTALVPFLGLAILGHWSERELGVAAGLAAVSLWCLADPD
jgi:hypothetical protein